MFYLTFLLPQVKGCTIITYKHGIYELPHELPKELVKTSYNESLVSSLPAKTKILLILAKNS